MSTPTFGPVLAELRNAAGLSQAGLAEAINMSRTYVSGIEQNQPHARPPGKDMCANIALFTGGLDQLWEASVADQLARLPEDLREHLRSANTIPDVDLRTRLAAAETEVRQWRAWFRDAPRGER